MTRPRPSYAHAFGGIVRFSLMRVMRSRRAVIAIVSMLVLVAAVAIGRKTGEQTAGDTWRSAVENAILKFIAYLLPFLFHASSFSEEHEDRTLAYLLVRPVPTSALVLGKYTASAIAAVSVSFVTVLLLFLASYVGSFDVAEASSLGKTLLATTLLVLGHGAIASSYSTMVPEQSTPLTVVHFALVELLMAKLPGVLALVSMHEHAMNIAGLTADADSSVPQLPLWGACAYIGIYSLFALGFAWLVASGREYRFAKS